MTTTIEYNRRAPRPLQRGPRPDMWITGPDLIEHKQYRAFIQHRNQSRWRKEDWQLTFSNYKMLWEGHWHLRGRVKGSECLTRTNYELPWELGNVEVVSRQTHAERQAHNRLGAREAI